MPCSLPQISFERDTVVSQNNEYEILQLLMSDCRVRLTNYASESHTPLLCLPMPGSRVHGVNVLYICLPGSVLMDDVVPGTMEELTKSLQRNDLSPRERLATRLLLSEQRILQGTVDAVRRCAFQLSSSMKLQYKLHATDCFVAKRVTRLLSVAH